MNTIRLDHFLQAQADPSSGYQAALAEIRRGQKRGHWIWYIFPQLAGLGRSSTSRTYALPDLATACAYLRHSVLGPRYTEITEAVQQQFMLGVPVENLMGGSLDAQKLVSSLTLFQAAGQDLAAADANFTSITHLCADLLRDTAARGYPACSHTLASLELG